MDFPVCPACGQSVIDDDVADCPFCGSSMSAKPGTKPAAKSAAPKPAAAGAKPAAAAAKSPAKPDGGGKPAAKQTDASDDFPFDTEVPGSKTAIQAMPNPSKARSFKVVCPMCETAGYVPPTASGKEVKCANPKCMVPIFKAPAPTVEAPPPPPPKKSNLMLVGGMTVVILAVIGGGLVFLASQPSPPAKKPGQMSEEDKALLAEMAGGNSKKAANTVTTTSSGSDTQPKNTETTTPIVTAPKSPEEMIATALKQMNDLCLVGDRRQRSKPYCRQLSAEACARVGEVAAAKEHMAQLIVVGAGVPYYRIEPNLDLFWLAWTAGDKSAAQSALDAALLDAPKLPKVGRNQLEVASKLAAALATVGRIPDARAQLEGHQTAELEGQLSARVQMATDGRVARLTTVRAMLPWLHPQAVAATGSLIARNQLDVARAWSLAQADDESQVECLALWAEGVARQQAQPGPADSNSQLVETVKEFSPALAARVWARAACGRWAAGDLDGATATLKRAQDLLASVPVPAEPEMPDVKQMMKYEIPAAKPLVQAATAATEIAFVQSLWPDRVSAAEETLELALTFARGLAPGTAAVSARINDADQAGANGLRDRLKKELGLKSDDLARQAVGTYRRILGDIGDASQQRFSLQTKLMSRLLDAGLKNKVWLVVSNRSAASNSSQRDDFLTTPLVGQLIEAFHGTETAKAVQGAVVGGAAPVRPDFFVVKELLQKPAIQQASAYVSKLDSNSGRRDDLALTFAAFLADEKKPDVAFEFISHIDDIVLREEAYRLVAAIAAQHGQADVLLKQVEIVNQVTEKVSLYRGLVAGLKAAAPVKYLPEAALNP
jgi:hypothetical protein